MNTGTRATITKLWNDCFMKNWGTDQATRYIAARIDVPFETVDAYLKSRPGYPASLKRYKACKKRLQPTRARHEISNLSSVPVTLPRVAWLERRIEGED